MTQTVISKGDPILLYSANTYLAFSIAEKYYRRTHFVWCSSHFDGRILLRSAAPPTSNPCEIIAGLEAEVTRGDRHGPKVRENREGLKKGAAIQLEAGTISNAAKQEIDYLATHAELAMFRPLLYVIPFAMVRKRVIRVPIEERASPLWSEFRIERLPARCFDVLDLSRS